MNADIHFKKNVPLCFIIFFTIIFNGNVYGETADTIIWKSIESTHTIIRYQSIEDLAMFNNSIKYGLAQTKAEINKKPQSHKTLENIISEKSDILFERVQDILDMRRKMKKVIINIYPNKLQLYKVYTQLFNEPCAVRAWYLFKRNTVYINASDLHEGILAHEIAHSVIDHFLFISPPPASSEILARYVDSHLHDQTVATSEKYNNPHRSSYTQ